MIGLNIWTSISQSANFFLSVCLPVCLSVRPSVCPSVCPSVRQSGWLAACLSACLPPVRLSVCPSGLPVSWPLPSAAKNQTVERTFLEEMIIPSPTVSLGEGTHYGRVRDDWMKTGTGWFSVKWLARQAKHLTEISMIIATRNTNCADVPSPWSLEGLFGGWKAYLLCVSITSSCHWCWIVLFDMAPSARVDVRFIHFTTRDRVAISTMAGRRNYRWDRLSKTDGKPRGMHWDLTLISSLLSNVNRNDSPVP